MRFLAALVGALALIPFFASAYNNPIIYEDLADLDIRRYNDTYYMSSSTMHFSPGAPILRSYDLVNWEYIGHSVPQLAVFGTQYTLPPGQNAYIKGIWASWLIFLPNQGKWFWGGCVDFAQTHIFSSSTSDPTSSWSQIATINECFYDSGAFQDDDNTVYVSYKNGGDNTIRMVQMSTDMKSVVKEAVAFTLPSARTSMEGTRPYKINSTYYIFSDDPSVGQEFVLKSSNNVWGTYALNNFITGAYPQTPLTGDISQGALVDTPAGDWYWIGFTSAAYPGGRIPCMFPVTWNNGLPSPVLSGTAVETSYPNPLTIHPVANLTGVDYFSGTSLGPQWEWNHDPDTTNFTVNNGLTLKTASVTNDWYAARNTLTHRVLGPTSTATIKMMFSGMADGDRAGLGLLRDQSAYIGVWRSGSTYTITMVNGMAMSSTWTTTSTGTTAGTASISGNTAFFRVIANSTPGGNSATFWYSTDGTTFHQLGPAFQGNTNWEFFEGERFAIFNFATKAHGGSVQVSDFELASGSYTGAAVGAGSSSSTVTTTTATTTTSATSKTTTSTVPSTGCTAALYAQCAGQGYTGCTTCAGGSTCTYSNPYYSQCL